MFVVVAKRTTKSRQAKTKCLSNNVCLFGQGFTESSTMTDREWDEKFVFFLRHDFNMISIFTVQSELELLQNRVMFCNPTWRK